MEGSSVAIMVANVHDGRLVEVNTQACRSLGYEREELLEQYVPDLASIYSEKGNSWAERVKWYREQEHVTFQTDVRCKDGSLMPVEVNLSYMVGETQDYVIGFVRNIAKRKRNERLRDGERHILELISKGNASLKQILLEIIQFTESQYESARCSVLLLEGDTLHHGAAPNLPDNYNTAVEGLKIGAAVGSCGTSAYRKQRVIVENVRTDPLWRDLQDLVSHYDFVACWSEPILDFHNNVLGIFAIYHNEACVPKKHEINLMQTMANLASIAIERAQMVAQLERSAAEWTQAMDKFDDIIYLLDKRRHLVRANQAFYRMINTDPAHSVGRVINELIHPDGEKIPCPVCLAQVEQRDDIIIMERDHPDNPLDCPTEFTVRMIRDKNGVVTGIVMKLHDLRLSRQIAQRHRLSTTVFESTAEGIFVTNISGVIVDANQSVEKITGYTRNEIIGQKASILKSGHHHEDFYREIWQTIRETGCWQGEIWNRHKDGEVYPEWMTISSVFNDQGKTNNYVAMFSDISAIKQSQKQLEHQAHYDALTELPNRLLLNARLNHALKHAQRNNTILAVIFLDLDNFKHINDSMGHTVGDQLLQEIARRLQQPLRQDDTVARIGGDEFVLLLENIDKPENIISLVEELMCSLNKHLELSGQAIHITASIGISVYPRDGKDAATLLSNADAAMYGAKEEGRNTYQFYTQELTSNAYERVFLKSNLHRALDCNELYLLYQPQINLNSGLLIGVEALIRWRHPDLGTISPAKFIPEAEECGLIHPVGQWVLDTACAQAKKWLDQGFDFGQISVNLSGRQLQRGNTSDDVMKSLEKSQLPADKLELEITENFIIRDADRAIDELNKLREHGVLLAIDDFGTGYSSLSHLKRLPIHKLKIDQSFVRDLSTDDNDLAIANAIIAMGNSLHLTVIAEGIETKQQANLLKEAGCQQGQGYLYSPPITADEMEILLTA